MRSQLIFAAAVSMGVASAQAPVTATAPAPSTSDLRLVGDRFKPLTYAEMTPAQKTMTDHLLAGERKGLGGPFNVLLRQPRNGRSGRGVRGVDALPFLDSFQAE